MIRKQIIATSGKDRHNQQIPEKELLEIVQKINEENASIRIGIEHDPTLLPIGKIVKAKMISINENEIAIEAEIDEFINDFNKMIGPYGDTWYMGESKLDTRPFVQNTHDYKGNILFSINPIYFQNRDFEFVKRTLEQEEIKVEENVQKAFSPEVQLVIEVVERLMVFLLLKKSTEKITDAIADDIVKLYSLLKKGIGLFFNNICEHCKKVVVLSASNSPIELVVSANDADLVINAYEKLEKMDIQSEIQKYETHFGDKIDKIQYLYTKEDEEWKVNYFTTKSGKSVGTEKCYLRATTMYNKVLNSPTAGFSISGLIKTEEEDNVRANNSNNF